MSRYEEIYNTAKGVMNGSVDIELPAISVFVIFVVSLIYMVTPSIIIGVYSRCSDVKCKTMYDTVFKYISNSLVAALTILLTLVFTKMFNNDTGSFMMLYGILGLVVSLVAVDLPRKCNVKDPLKVMWSRFSFGLHTIVLLPGLFLSARTVA